MIKATTDHAERVMTWQIPIQQVAAFAEAPFQGNPAAVCSLDAWLPDSLLQSIAAENNLSETAFVVGADGCYSLRWFTPSCEVDLCGHATLAAAHVVFQQDDAHEQITFESRSGDLLVRRKGERLTLDFPVQKARPCDAPEALNKALNLNPVACLQGVDLIAVVADEATVQSLTPDLTRVASLPGRGLIVTASGSDVDFVSRFFAPGLGIDEDPVTGSAHCSLAPYWAERLGRNSLQALQLSERSGSLHCQLQGERVLITGRVMPFLSGVIHLDELTPLPAMRH